MRPSTFSEDFHQPCQALRPRPPHRPPRKPKQPKSFVVKLSCTFPFMRPVPQVVSSSSRPRPAALEGPRQPRRHAAAQTRCVNPIMDRAAIYASAPIKSNADPAMPKASHQFDINTTSGPSPCQPAKISAALHTRLTAMARSTSRDNRYPECRITIVIWSSGEINKGTERHVQRHDKYDLGGSAGR